MIQGQESSSDGMTEESGGVYAVKALRVWTNLGLRIQGKNENPCAYRQTLGATQLIEGFGGKEGNQRHHGQPSGPMTILICGRKVTTGN